MRSGFLQTLPGKGWFYRGFCVAIPSKWGLVSYLYPKQTMWMISLVAIPSKWGLVSYTASVLDFPLIRLVAIPSKWGLVSYTASVLDFPLIRLVAIPSKWGLVSYSEGLPQVHLECGSVAIPSKWGLVSYWQELLKPEEVASSQSLLNEVWFPTIISENELPVETDVAIPSKWGLVSYTRRVQIWLNLLILSQSLLNEVWFPTKPAKVEPTSPELRRNPF